MKVYRVKYGYGNRYEYRYFGRAASAIVSAAQLPNATVEESETEWTPFINTRYVVKWTVGWRTRQATFESLDQAKAFALDYKNARISMIKNVL